jgi:hypothetical protein
MTQTSQGARTRLSYVEETVVGVTPAPGFKLKNIPFATHSLDITKDRVEGDDILGDRMQRVDRHGNVQSGGDIVTSFRETDYDDLLASAFLSDWVNDELRIGTTLKTFTFEDASLDISQFRVIRGLAVNTLALSIAPNAMVRATFTMVGTGGVQSPTTIGDGANAVHTSDEPFDSFSGVLIDEDGPLGRVSSLELNVTNSLSPLFEVGSKDAFGLEFGNAVVTGNLVCYYRDAALINKFLNENEGSLEVSISNPTASAIYTIKLPRIKLNGAAVPVQNPQSRFITIPIVALLDAIEGSPIVITRDLNPGAPEPEPEPEE